MGLADKIAENKIGSEIGESIYVVEIERPYSWGQPVTLKFDTPDAATEYAREMIQKSGDNYTEEYICVRLGMLTRLH